jgi:hypothetical protein
MKNLGTIKIGIALLFIWISIQSWGQKTAFQQQLELLPEVKSVQTIEHVPFFSEAFELMVEQPIDHSNPAKGKFLQRVMLSNYNPYSPVVFVTEGYAADYATRATYINELSSIINANQIVVEHRFFGKSVPDNPSWDDLTIENSCADLHRIYRIFSKIYNSQNKWIATGISKGGTQTLLYNALYPTDMHIWIPYVAPINFKVEDGRHEVFLEKVGSANCRTAITEFQKRVLQQREQIIPLLDSLVKANNYTMRISMDELLDYCVLEYNFSFWQWGHSCAKIPSATDSYRAHFSYLVDICSPDYFVIEGIKSYLPFFVQAQHQLGYYGYQTEHLKPYLKIDDAENYLKKIFLPEEVNYKFSNKMSKKVVKSINKNGNRVMLIYGEVDPWTASGVTPNRKSKAVRVVSPNHNHRARITDLPISIKKDVYMTLETWLEQD